MKKLLVTRQLLLVAVCTLCSLFVSSAIAQSPDETPKEVDLELFRPRPMNTSKNLDVIAFGSCNRVDQPQTIWFDVAANNPDLWVWLGDIIYADTTNTRALAKHYKRLKTHPAYKKLRANTQITGIYDDHDYGANDAGKGLPNKRGSQRCLLDFLDVPYRMPVRKQQGAYHSYLYGTGDKQIKVIVMDTRYFRDTLIKDPNPKRRYYPNMQGDVLGEAQWQWLERELSNSPAKLHLLCSSIQVLADEHGHEKWGNFPNARKRLLRMIVKTKPKNLIILSGDRHMAEVTKMDLVGLPYPLYDFTSSGLTHVRSSQTEANKMRVGAMIVKRNFGVLKIAWEGLDPVVTMEVRGIRNELYQTIKVKY